MPVISEKDAKRISRAIARAEKKTAGEIVAVLAERSDDYLFIPFLWAALAALLVPIPLFLASSLSAIEIYGAQLAAFALLALPAAWMPLRVRLVPAAIRHARAHRHAMEQFLAQNLLTTKGRTGVMIFVSLAERFAEVVADEAIYAKVPPETWEEIVEVLTGHIRKGETAAGFIEAVARCGALLAEHFPPPEEPANQLPDHLIILE